MRRLLWFLPAVLAVAVLVAVLSRRGAPPPTEGPGTPVADPEAPTPDEIEPDRPAPDAAEALLKDRGADAEERIAAVDALVDRFAESDIPLLRKALMDPGEDLTVRSQILAGLGRSGEKKAFDLLAEFHRTQPAFPSRHVLIKAIGDLQKGLELPEARRLLSESLSAEPSAGARSHAARALEVPAPSADEREALKTAVLSDASANVRLVALGVLARLGGEKAFLETLRDMPQTPERVRKLAERALQDPGR